MRTWQGFPSIFQGFLAYRVSFGKVLQFFLVLDLCYFTVTEAVCLQKRQFYKARMPQIFGYPIPNPRSDDSDTTLKRL